MYAARERRIRSSACAAVEKERDELNNAREQLHIRLRERRRIFFGDVEGIYVSEDDLAELRKDKERLDWLEKNADANHLKAGVDARVSFGWACNLEDIREAIDREIESSRAAIDAARAQEGRK